MISKIIIKGYQRHKHLVLELDPGVTTIVGSTDQGKSAVLRALRWVCLNKPRGDDFINWEGARCAVTIRVEDHKITRAKGKDENTYIMDGKDLNAIGNDVPRDVMDILRIAPENFQEQHDPHFWISLPPPEVSRRLNEVVDLSVIDTTLSNLATSLRKTNAEKEVVQERLDGATKERRDLKYIKDAHTDLKEVERLDARHASLALRARAVGELAQRGLNLSASLQRIQGACRDGALVVSLGNQLEEATENMCALRNMVQEARKYKRTTQQKLPDLMPLEKIATTLKSLYAKEREGLGVLVVDAKTMMKAVKTYTKATAEASIALKEELGDECLLCGNPLQ